MTDQKPIEPSNTKVWLVGFMLLVAALVVALQYIPGCSVAPKPPVVVNPPVGCGELSVGQTKETSCDGGKRIYLCTEAGLKEQSNTCSTAPQCDKVAFATEIKPILTDRCLGCHFSPGKIDDYATAKAWASEISRRIALGPDSRDHMPLPPNPDLEPEQKALIQQWVTEGATETPVCTGTRTGQEPPGFLDLGYIETSIVDDLNHLESEDQQNARYLVTAHKVDEGLAPAELADYEKAANKTLNSINAHGIDVFKATAVDPAKSIWRFDLRAFGLDSTKWKAIEAGDKIKIVSATSKGQIIRTLTRTDQPWFHAENFSDTVLRNTSVYHALVEIQATLAQQQALIGVDLNDELKEGEAVLIGGNTSPITLLKNRLVSRASLARQSDAYYWQTFDTVDLGAGKQLLDRNLFDFPGLAAAGTKKNFKFDASEVIFSLPNGFQAYGLFNSAGARQDVAPLNVVRDNESPISPEIRNSNSCFRCHSGGLIPMVDEIRNHIVGNASSFPGDVEKLIGLPGGSKEFLYHSASANAATFAADQKTFGKALQRVGINPLDANPVSIVTDRFLLDWNLHRLASFLFLSDDVLKEGIEQSPTAKTKIGQLRTGGTVSFNQVVDVLPDLIKELGLFRDR